MGCRYNNNKQGGKIVKIKPKNHKKVRKQRTNRPPVDEAFRKAMNSNRRKNGMVKIGTVIDEILVTRT